MQQRSLQNDPFFIHRTVNKGIVSAAINSSHVIFSSVAKAPIILVDYNVEKGNSRCCHKFALFHHPLPKFPHSCYIYWQQISNQRLNTRRIFLIIFLIFLNRLKKFLNLFEYMNTYKMNAQITQTSAQTHKQMPKLKP